MRAENPRAGSPPWPGAGACPRRRAVAAHWALWLSLALAPACGESLAAGRDRVRIGVLLPAGAAQHWADEVWTGLQLGLGDQPVEFVRRDHGGDPARAAQMVLDLADEGVSVIVGPLFSTSCLAAAERAESLRVPLITPSGTHEAITSGRDWIFRTCFSNLQQGERIADFAIERLGLERFAVLKDVSNDYSLGLAERFAETVLMRNSALTGEMIYRQGRVDGDELRAWLATETCQAVYVPGYFDDVWQILRETEAIWRERPLVFLGGDGWDALRLVDPAEHLPDCYYTTHFVMASPDGIDRAAPAELPAFLSGYRARHGAAGGEAATTPPATAALGYDTGLLLRRALAARPATREELRDALRRELAGFRGITGAFETRDGELAKQIHVMHVSGQVREPRCGCEGH